MFLHFGQPLPPPPSKLSSVQTSPPHSKRCLVGCGSPFMRLAKNLAALRAWRKQCPPPRPLEKTDVLRVPGKCKGAQVYVQTTTTTTIHDISHRVHPPPATGQSGLLCMLCGRNTYFSSVIIIVVMSLGGGGGFGDTFSPLSPH